jgi:hypothetical protein
MPTGGKNIGYKSTKRGSGIPKEVLEDCKGFK